MPSETITHFYNEIVFLAAKIGELGLPDKFIAAARTKDSENIEDILDQSEAMYPEFWERLLKLYDDYKEAKEPKIFCYDESENGYRYNPEEIDPLNLCFVLMLSEGNMTDTDILDDWEMLPRELIKKDYVAMALEANEASVSSLVYNLMRAYGY